MMDCAKPLYVILFIIAFLMDICSFCLPWVELSRDCFNICDDRPTLSCESHSCMWDVENTTCTVRPDMVETPVEVHLFQAKGGHVMTDFFGYQEHLDLHVPGLLLVFAMCITAVALAAPIAIPQRSVRAKVCVYSAFSAVLMHVGAVVVPFKFIYDGTCTSGNISQADFSGMHNGMGFAVAAAALQALSTLFAMFMGCCGAKDDTYYKETIM